MDNESKNLGSSDGAPEEGRMVSIWTWTSLILGAYGLLLLGVGVLNRATDTPPVTRLAELHPDLWWPGVMLLAAGGLFLAGRKG